MTSQMKTAGLVSAVALLGACLAGTWGGGTAARGAEPARSLPAPMVDEAPGGTGTQTLIVAGGCFWGVQGVFQHVRGVTSAVSGYDGGTAATAQYGAVSTGTTGHAESVRITYDPRVVTYGRLLQIFFSVATDPTQLNQQYPDHGPQYRSEVFATTPEQVRVARSYIAQLDHSGSFPKAIATVVGQDSGFFPAEQHHQDFLTLHPDMPYIAVYDLPKVAALKASFPADYRPEPALVGSQGS